MSGVNLLEAVTNNPEFVVSIWLVGGEFPFIKVKVVSVEY